MNCIGDIYTVSIKDHRAGANKLLRENEQCYDSLNDKDTEYARMVKALQDLHRQVADIYNNAPDRYPKG